LVRQNSIANICAHPRPDQDIYTMKRRTELIAALSGVLIASTTMLAASEAIAFHHVEQRIARSAARLERVALPLNADLKPAQALSGRMGYVAGNAPDRAPSGLQERMIAIAHMRGQTQ
jgi:hypothetical protein